MISRVYAPKPACPVDLGLYQCSRCKRLQKRREREAEGPVSFVFCGNQNAATGRICGVTHLGYRWCGECRRNGADLLGSTVLHIGQYEAVSESRSEPDEEAGLNPSRMSLDATIARLTNTRFDLQMQIAHLAGEEERRRAIENLAAIDAAARYLREFRSLALRFQRVSRHAQDRQE